MKALVMRANETGVITCPERLAPALRCSFVDESTSYDDNEMEEMAATWSTVEDFGLVMEAVVEDEIEEATAAVPVLDGDGSDTESKSSSADIEMLGTIEPLPTLRRFRILLLFSSAMKIIWESMSRRDVSWQATSEHFVTIE
jgi:hypothetical protein